ncbi:MAG: ribosome assembly cofactor RimP [Bacteroidales bacterium]
MIDGKIIKNILEQYLDGGDLFLVEVKVSRNNVIIVTIDGDNGVMLDNCIEISKYIEKQLDRDKEDFELTVTSSGLGDFFTLDRQYKKNIGKSVEVVMRDNYKENGVIEDIRDGKLFLSKKKQSTMTVIDLNEIEKTRVVISF